MKLTGLFLFGVLAFGQDTPSTTSQIIGTIKDGLTKLDNVSDSMVRDYRLHDANCKVEYPHANCIKIVKTDEAFLATLIKCAHHATIKASEDLKQVSLSDPKAVDKAELLLDMTVETLQSCNASYQDQVKKQIDLIKTTSHD